MSEFLFTSESVSEGHPDKVADQISDAVLDAILEQDPYGRVAAETLVSTGLVVLAGEITTSAQVAANAAASDQPAQVFDSGKHLIVSGPSQLSVLNALEDLSKTGAKVISPIQKVGNKWMATCDHPPTAGSGCKVEELGFMRIVTGPSREGVEEKLQELLHSGARLVHDIEQAQGVWTAVCEVTSH